MSGITLAWLIGEGIIVARSVVRDKRPPSPGALLASSGFFVLLALVAEYQPARTAATLIAFGVDIAAWLEMPYITPPPVKTNEAPGPVRAGGGQAHIAVPQGAAGS